MLRKAFLGVVMLLIVGTTSQAQYPYGNRYQPGNAPGYRPPVSPYLNLLRRGNSPSYNYYTLVRPQLQFQQSVQGLQGQLNTVQQSVTTLSQPGQQGVPSLPPTGQPAGFMTHQRYFMTNGGGAFGTTGTPLRK